MVLWDARLTMADELLFKPTSRNDRLLPFFITALDVRGHALRLDQVLNEVLLAHQYPPLVAHLLAEALTLTALVGAILRDGGAQVTLQARSNGPVSLLVTDFLVPGQIRGYAAYDESKVAALSGQPRLETLCGQGYLALTIDQPTTDHERYQGIVPLEGVDLAEAAQNYFETSEQIPTLCKLAARFDPLRARWYAGGLLLQHLPKSEEGGPRLFASEAHPHWQHARALAATTQADELTDPSLPLEDLLWRLFHDEAPTVVDAIPLHKGCRCSIDRIQGVLRQFSFEELIDMREPDGSFRINCAFCSKDWVIEAPKG